MKTLIQLVFIALLSIVSTSAISKTTESEAAEQTKNVKLMLTTKNKAIALIEKGIKKLIKTVVKKIFMKRKN